MRLWQLVGGSNDPSQKWQHAVVWLRKKPSDTRNECDAPLPPMGCDDSSHLKPKLSALG